MIGALYCVRWKRQSLKTKRCLLKRPCPILTYFERRNSWLLLYREELWECWTFSRNIICTVYQEAEGRHFRHGLLRQVHGSIISWTEHRRRKSTFTKQKTHELYRTFLAFRMPPFRANERVQFDRIQNLGCDYVCVSCSKDLLWSSWHSTSPVVRPTNLTRPP